MMNSKLSLKKMNIPHSETYNKTDRSLLLLRDIAVCLVILTHVSAQWLDRALQEEGLRLSAAHFCNILSFAGVSLFVMLSGSIYLSSGHRQRSTSPRFMAGKALRFFLIYLFWKLFYYAEDLLLNPVTDADFSAAAIKDKFLLAMFRSNGKYHLWYLPMFCLLLLLVPLIYEGARQLKACALYLSIFFAAAILLPTAFLFEFPYKYLLMDFRNIFDLGHYLGYLGYFLLGHVLYELGKSRRRPLLSAKHLTVPLWIAAWAATFIATSEETARSFAAGITDSSFATPFILNTFVLSSTLFFTFCRPKDGTAKGLPDPQAFVSPDSGFQASDSQALGSQAFASQASGSFSSARGFGRKCLASLARSSFGIYLIHPFVLDLVQKAGLMARLADPVVGIPLFWAVLLSVSWLLCALLRRVPVVRNLL